MTEQWKPTVSWLQQFCAPYDARFHSPRIQTVGGKDYTCACDKRRMIIINGKIDGVERSSFPASFPEIKKFITPRFGSLVSLPRFKAALDGPSHVCNCRFCEKQHEAVHSIVIDGIPFNPALLVEMLRECDDQTVTTGTKKIYGRDVVYVFTAGFYCILASLDKDECELSNAPHIELGDLK